MADGFPPIDFERYLVALHLTRPASFHFNHGGALRGLLSAAIGVHELDAGVIPFACESGRVLFRPGDLYHFGLTLVGGSTLLAGKIKQGLARVGSASPPRNGPLPALAGNFELVAVTRVETPDLTCEAKELTQRDRLTLRFLSPFRLERPPALRRKRASYLNGECFPAGYFLRRLWARLFHLGNGSWPTQEERETLCPPVPEECVTEEARLLWLDIPVDGRPGKDPARPRGYTLGGVLGSVVLRRVPPAWVEALVLGRYLHAGEKTAFGLGRYVVDGLGGVAGEPFHPASTALERIAAVEPLDRALGHVLSRSEAAGVDDVKPEDIAADRGAFLTGLAECLGDGSYEPPPLLGIVAKKDDGRYRTLAVPTLIDRAAQHAACAELGPAVETLLEDCSWAYRKGLSRIGAAEAIRKSYEAGFRYVLDADITSFFDAVEWGRIEAKLDALFPFEPLVGLVKRWARAPVLFQGNRVERDRGLPQGAGVSPLLANLYLDEFDEELLGKKYRLVRYADDFVVLCRDVEEARRAAQDARAALAGLSLTLNEVKTSIRSFDEGFSYLGYLFCRSLVLEKETAASLPPPELPPEQAIPPFSWLSQVPLDQVRVLTVKKIGTQAPQAIEVVPVARSASTSITRNPRS